MLRNLTKRKIWKFIFFKSALNSSLRAWKCKETKMAEEYSWAITQAAWRSRYSVLEFIFQRTLLHGYIRSWTWVYRIPFSERSYWVSQGVSVCLYVWYIYICVCVCVCVCVQKPSVVPSYILNCNRQTKNAPLSRQFVYWRSRCITPCEAMRFTPCCRLVQCRSLSTQ